MSDETDTSVETEQLSTDTPTSPFNADGTLVENWQNLAPEGYEDLREDKTLPRLKNIWDMGRSYVSVRKQVPLDKMPRPNDNFSEADWNEFYNAGGRPDTPGDYNIQRPEEIPEEMMSKEMIDGYHELFHKIGLSKKQSDALVAYNNENAVNAIKDQAQMQELEGIKLKDNLTVKWGRAYDQNVHLGNIAIEKGVKGDEGLKERLIEKVNKDPDLIEFASNLGGLFAEHKIVESANIPTPADIQTQITALEQDPRYLSPDKNVRMPLVNQVMRLREQMVKDKQPG